MKQNVKLKLKFPLKEIQYYADRYSYEEDKKVIAAGERAKQRGYYTKSNFINLTLWKTRRSKSHCKKNDESLIKEVTKIALLTKNEYLKINVLQILKGVSLPTASVLLHFATNFNYPILDFRALWSLGVDSGVKYNFELWKTYTKYCRELSHKANVDMRTLDRALWQYSKEHQK